MQQSGLLFYHPNLKSGTWDNRETIYFSDSLISVQMQRTERAKCKRWVLISGINASMVNRETDLEKSLILHFYEGNKENKT